MRFEPSSRRRPRRRSRVSAKQLSGVVEDARVFGHVEQERGPETQFLGRLEDRRKPGVDSEVGGRVEQRLQPARHGAELLDPSDPTIRQIFRHEEEVDVGVSPGRGAADGPVNGESGQPASVVRLAGLEDGAKEVVVLAHQSRSRAALLGGSTDGHGSLIVGRTGHHRSRASPTSRVRRHPRRLNLHWVRRRPRRPSYSRARLQPRFAAFCARSIFAQVSRSVTVRLNTGASGRLSGSTQK